MYDSIVENIICSEFDNRYGKGAGLETHSHPTHAMQVTFNLHAEEGEEGYRHLKVLIFGGGLNYISVYAKADWVVISDSDVVDDDYVKAEYTKGETPWVCYGHHDSGWREAVENLLKEFRHRVGSIDSLFVNRGWYNDVALTEEQIEELRQIRYERYSHGYDRKKVSELEFKFPNEESHAD